MLKHKIIHSSIKCLFRLSLISCQKQLNLWFYKIPHVSFNDQYLLVLSLSFVYWVFIRQGTKNMMVQKYYSFICRWRVTKLWNQHTTLCSNTNFELLQFQYALQLLCACLGAKFTQSILRVMRPAQTFLQRKLMKP